MPRKAEEDEAREVIVPTRFSTAGAKELDRKRGAKSRGEYVRYAVEIAPAEKG